MLKLLADGDERISRRVSNGEANRLSPADRPAHDWYRFVFSFPPHLVREYLARFGVGRKKVVLDPFCGTGTTLIESAKLGISSIGVEANPMAYFASQVKVDWSPDPEGLLRHARKVAEYARAQLEHEGIEDEPSLPLFRKEKNSSLGHESLPSATSPGASRTSPGELHQSGSPPQDLSALGLLERA